MPFDGDIKQVEARNKLVIAARKLRNYVATHNWTRGARLRGLYPDERDFPNEHYGRCILGAMDATETTDLLQERFARFLRKRSRAVAALDRGQRLFHDFEDEIAFYNDEVARGKAMIMRRLDQFCADVENKS